MDASSKTGRIIGMKVSISLPDEDIAFVDRYAHDNQTSRSDAIHQAIYVLRQRDLVGEYEAADSEWTASGETDLWDAVTADGLR
jgi:Arc/MetJ-type ribon-helix-helix transcriptional regulator